MARLDANTTLNGNQIWHTGNFDPARVTNAFYIQAGQTAYGNVPNVTLALGDHDTGFQWIADGTFAVYANNAERVRFTAAGRVGIGTTNPSALLHVSGTAQVDGNAVFSTLITLPSVYGTNTIKGGSGDNATYATHNVRMQSWWGIGFEDHAGGVNGVYDARTGTWKVKGGYSLAASDTAGVATTITQDGDKTTRITNANGWVEVGAKNTGAAHLYTDRPIWAMNKPLVVQSSLQIGDGSQTLIGLTNGVINGQAIVLTNDARLKSWGNLAVSGNTLQRLGTDMIGSDGTAVYLNQSGAHTGGVRVNGNLGMSGAVRWDSTVNPGSDYAQISYQSDNNTYALHGDSNENGTLIIEAGNDMAGVPSADVIVLKSAATIVDGGTGSRMRVMNPEGFVDIGAQNTSAMHFITDRPLFYFNKDVTAVNSIGVYGSSTVLTATGGLIAGQRILTAATVAPEFVEGSRTIKPASGDLNLLNTTGVYNHPTPTNGIAADWTYVLHMAHSDDPANWATQIAQHFHTDALKVRRRTAGGWQPWQTIWTSANFDPASKASLTGAAFTGTISSPNVTVTNTLSTPFISLTGDAVYRRAGRKGIIQHLPDANQMIFAFEATAGANNWDWPNQFVFDTSGTFTTRALNTTSLNVTSNTAALRGGAADHTYFSFFPRAADVNLRGGYFGFPAAGSTAFTWMNELTGMNATLGGSFQVRTGSTALLTVGADGTVTTTNRATLTAATGALDASLYARSNLILNTTDGSNPSLGFIRSGTDAISLVYKGGNDLFLQYTGESRIWHSGNLNPLLVGRLRTTVADQDTAPNAYDAGTIYVSDFTPAANGIGESVTLTVSSADGNRDGTYQLAKTWGVGGQLAYRSGASNTTWGGWRTLWDTGNFNPATKADLSGATFTGTVTATDFIKSSRRELKQDIAPYSADALTELDALDIVTFRYRNAPDAEHVGIIADDTANPHVSGENRDGFNTANTTAILVRAVQQLLRRVEDLEAQLGDR